MTQPPIKLDGLLKLIVEGNAYFDKDEMHAMARSEAGLKIGKAISQCQGIRAKANDAKKEFQKNPDSKDLQQKLRVESGKYKQCLAYATCTEKYNRYFSCSQRALQTINVQQGQDIGETIEYHCSRDRHTTERCIGKLVAGTVRAAEVPSLDSDFTEND